MSTERLFLTCTICRAPLSDASVARVSGDALEPFEGRELVPPFSWVLASEVPALFPSSTVHAADVLLDRSALTRVVEAGARGGCCGPDGCDGPNLFCEQGHAVGTEVGDCWRPKFVHAHPEEMRLTELMPQ